MRAATPTPTPFVSSRAGQYPTTPDPPPFALPHPGLVGVSAQRSPFASLRDTADISRAMPNSGQRTEFPGISRGSAAAAAVARTISFSSEPGSTHGVLQRESPRRGVALRQSDKEGEGWGAPQRVFPPGEHARPRVFAPPLNPPRPGRPPRLGSQAYIRPDWCDILRFRIGLGRHRIESTAPYT